MWGLHASPRRLRGAMRANCPVPLVRGCCLSDKCMLLPMAAKWRSCPALPKRGCRVLAAPKHGILAHKPGWRISQDVALAHKQRTLPHR